MHPARRSLVLAAASALAMTGLAGCGDDAPAGRAPVTTAGAPTSAPAPTTEPAAPPDRGWLGGEPQWRGDGDEFADRAGAPGAESAAVADAGAVAPPVAHAVPAPVGDLPSGPLRAGSVDDNADFADYLAYLDRIAGLGIPLRPVDPTGRVTIRVVGSDGLPLAGAEVHVAVPDGDGVVVRTTADGTARFHPALYGVAVTDEPFTLSVGAATATAAAGDTVELVLDQPGGRPAPIAVDILFLLDATGSMGDEIERLKTSIDSVAARVSALDGSPDVRFGMTLYRDEGDTFVTGTRDFTADIEAFRTDLGAVVADGGGDYPEALEEGLAEALTAPAWRDPANTLQIVFLVADAPPQIGRQVPQPYDESLRQAIARGLKIFPVASSESDDQAEAVFRQLAQGTGARFVFLSYGAGGAATGSQTDIVATDYEELALDDLVVRLVAEELAALTGDGTVVPPVTVPPPVTSTPPGQ